ncbi:MAG TPA: hypothetical protein VKR06_05790 [Ktedonosporobacter sp.]|nr:hypothetical protein [Ktedonosporobacter sp.]
MEQNEDRCPSEVERPPAPPTAQMMAQFISATGLRAVELARLHTNEIVQQADGHVYIHVSGNGYPARTVPVLAGQEQVVLQCAAQARTWTHYHTERRELTSRTTLFPAALLAAVCFDIDVLRTAYAQALAQQLHQTLIEIGSVGDVDEDIRERVEQATANHRPHRHGHCLHRLGPLRSDPE